MKISRLIIVFLLLMLTSCSHRTVYQSAPEGVSISGIWLFEQQDRHSFQRLLDALNYVPFDPKDRLRTETKRRSSSNSHYEQQILLRDLLVGLLTIIPRELYIEQSEKQVAIDFGVAGYHSFNIKEKTEILMDGIEIDAYAGWKGRTFFIELGMGMSYQLIEKFTLLNENQLVETIELKVTGRDSPLSHKRYFERSIKTPNN